VLVAIYARDLFNGTGGQIPNMEVTAAGAEEYARVGRRGVEHGSSQRSMFYV
jgi:hypothetical protein